MCSFLMWDSHWPNVMWDTSLVVRSYDGGLALWRLVVGRSPTGRVDQRFKGDLWLRHHFDLVRQRWWGHNGGQKAVLWGVARRRARWLNSITPRVACLQALENTDMNNALSRRCPPLSLVTPFVPQSSRNVLNS
ncbi:unnamed protein product [Arctogadus glacialis]